MTNMSWKGIGMKATYFCRFAILMLLFPCTWAIAARNDAGEAPRADTGCDCASYGGCACPIFPIMVMGSGTVYYCDYFATSCDDDPEAAYAIGDYNWPYQHCDGDCIPLPSRTDSTTPIFQGLKYAVGLGYMHKHSTMNEIDDPLPKQVPGESRIPGGPARACCRVFAPMNNLFLKFTNSAGTTTYAKVLKFEINYEKARYETDLGHWQTRYVAFEVNGTPGPEREVLDVLDQSPLPDHAIRAHFRTGMGQRAAVLILLKR